MKYKPLPKVDEGYQRFYYECKSCGNECYMDQIPYSRSNPILSLPCGCLIVSHISNHLKSISKADFYVKYKHGGKK